ncbi:Dynein regulatory complex subunit 5 [Mytilus edulis]|uniref:Dynein regulatory complex subunit 5 n=1 Tax=Mytilus edulis TaxID=6550 RepID=A0A8S3VJD9_MYTED|nr:Dynein regulatory complex subunit 5 [Mytilus edulis]
MTSPPRYKSKVLDKISTDIPLKITANLVQEEDYWNRCCKARWEICDVSQYGGNWKRMYFERNLQQIVENFVPETTDPNELNETLPLSANYVKKLDVQQLLPPVREAPKGPDFDDASDAGSDAGDEPECDHFNFAPVLKCLTNLEELHLTYGVSDCGMNFEWNLFKFTARDCLQLAQCVAACKHLKVFHLSRSTLDDDKTRVLISHILDHPSLTTLDLSHNTISDRGARAIGKFLNNRSQLIQEGMEVNTTVTHMDLNITDCGQEAEYCIQQILHRNKETERQSKIQDNSGRIWKRLPPQAAHRFKPEVPTITVQ